MTFLVALWYYIYNLSGSGNFEPVFLLAGVLTAPGNGKAANGCQGKPGRLPAFRKVWMHLERNYVIMKLSNFVSAICQSDASRE